LKDGVDGVISSRGWENNQRNGRLLLLAKSKTAGVLPKMGGTPNYPKLDQLSIETHRFSVFLAGNINSSATFSQASDAWR